MEPAWGRLAPLETVDGVRSRYQRRHERQLSTGKAHEIVAHISHARQQFESAATAGTLARPLLQYYGVLALSRAVILFNDPRLREGSLSPGHGVRGLWTSTLQQGKPLLAVELELGTKGTFPELVRASGNLEAFKVMPPPGRFDPPVAKLWVGAAEVGSQKLTLDAIVSRLPNLAGDYETTFDTRANCLPAIIIEHNPDCTEFVLLEGALGSPSEEEVRELLAIGLDTELSRGKRGRLGDVWTYKTEGDEARLPWVLNAAGRAHLVSPCVAELSSLLLLFLASFAFGTLVRYHPTAWSDMVDHRGRDVELPLMTALASSIQMDFRKRHSKPCLVGRLNQSETQISRGRYT